MTTLLVADDSVTIQRVVELTFADEGIRVIAVGTGEGAIARIDEECPDIVLADVGMPGVDGYQVATHIKRKVSALVPVLLLTGAFEPIDEERARETGCDGVLVKPFEPRQLIKTVRGLLDGARPAELWPADMPRLELGSPRPAAASAFAAPPSAPAVHSAPVVPEARTPDVSPDGAHMLSVPYEADTDPDLAAALARLEFVAMPEAPNVTIAQDHLVPEASAPFVAPRTPSSLEWDLSAAPAASRAVPGVASQSLGSVFSALLAAERKNPDARAIGASPALTESAVEEVVQKVVRRMTDELVRKIVLETAERLIREEIARIKA